MTPLPAPLRLLLALALPACAGAAGEDAPVDRPTGRGVLVIAVDAWRFDHTSFPGAGYDRPTTERLAAWAAAEGVVFSDAWSAAPLMVPAHVALLTGCDPTVASVPEVVLSDGTRQQPLTPWFVPHGVPALAEEFLAEGWTTAAFVDHAEIGGLRGFDRGFRDFDRVGGERKREWRIGLGGVAQRFVDWVRGLEDDEDWFAYVHLNDLEALWRRDEPDLEPRFEPRPALDYVPPVAFRSPVYYALNPDHAFTGQPTLGEYEVHYDTALEWLDRNLVWLPRHLEDEGHLADTTIVLVGTYGIGFGEAGFLLDSGSFSAVDLHVPLVIRPAPSLGIAPQVSDALVSTIDLAPTLLELAGLAVPAGMHGRSLTPLLRGTADSVRDATFAAHGHAEGMAVVDERWIWSLTYPGSRGMAVSSSWFGDYRQHREEAVEVLRERTGVGPPTPPGVPVGVVDPPAAAALRALGEAWYADLGRAREVLHPSAWNADKRGPTVVEELRAKGLIGDP